ncbi:MULTISPECIES: hypothetical protein [unclassified Leptolyngbya]|uniref:hypothetical protein n=1 Tax=unclassified Leptolyngbya TaxID=2650499 RepID=UPI001F5581FD|nr:MULTISPECIES: hypothetical protein [unclassified Leptolyngbya]
MKADEVRQEAEGTGQKMEDEATSSTSLSRWLKRLRGGFWVGLGFMLSPLSWWNDLFFNLPIAYGFGYLVRFFAPEWFLPATVVGYWLSNVLGILMMQFGATDVLFENRERNLKKDVLMGVGTSTLYTLAVVALVYFHVLETPQLFP